MPELVTAMDSDCTAQDETLAIIHQISRSVMFSVVLTAPAAYLCETKSNKNKIHSFIWKAVLSGA